MKLTYIVHLTSGGNDRSAASREGFFKKKKNPPSDVGKAAAETHVVPKWCSRNFIKNNNAVDLIQVPKLHLVDQD